MSAAAGRDVFVRGLLRSILDRCGAAVPPASIPPDRALRVVAASRLAALLAETIERAPAARADRAREDVTRLLERRYQDLQRSRGLDRELLEARAAIAALTADLEKAREKTAREEAEEAGRVSRRRALSEETAERVRGNEIALIAAREELGRAHALLRERALEVNRAVEQGEAARERVRGLEAEADARRREIAALEARLEEALAAGGAKAELLGRAGAESTQPSEAAAPLAIFAAPASACGADDAALSRLADILGGGRAS